MRNITLLTIIGFILFMANGVTGPISSLYAESLGANYVNIGMLGTVSSLTAVAFGTIWGSLSDRLGSRRGILLLGLLFVAVSHQLVALAALFPDYRVLYAFYILRAAAHAAYGTSSLALLGDLMEQQDGKRGQRMGIYRGLASLGFGLMALNAGAIADHFSLSAPYWLAAGFTLVAALLALLLREPSGARQGRLRDDLRLFGVYLLDLPKQVVRALRERLNQLNNARANRQAVRPDETAPVEGLPLAPLLVSALLWSLVTGAVYAVWANYMVDEVGYRTATMSRLWAVASLSEFPLMIVAGWLSDKVGRLTMLCLGFVAWTLVFLGYIVAPQMPWILGIQLTRGFAYSAFTATAMAYAAEVRGRAYRGRVSGLYSSAGGLGAIMGGLVGGSLTQLLGFRLMIGVNAGLILCGAIYLGVVALKYRAVAVPARAQVA